MRALLIDQATMVIVATGKDHRAFKLLGDRMPGLEFALDTEDEPIKVGQTYVAPNCNCLEDAPTPVLDAKLKERIKDIELRLVLLGKASRMITDFEKFDVLSPELRAEIERYEDDVCSAFYPDNLFPLSDYVWRQVQADTSMIQGGVYVQAR